MTRQCPVCKSDHFKSLFEGVDADSSTKSTISISKCQSCGLGVSNIPADYKSELYFEGYYGEATQAQHGAIISLFQKERQALAIAGRRPGNVLDIGCGDGTFLSHLPKPWIRFGYEPSTAGQSQLEKKAIQFFDLFNPDQTRFDVITMWHSFEHIANPSQTLQAIKPLLEADGQLFISVPNFSSWQARFSLGNWFHLDPTRHLYHYSQDNLLRILQDNGFRICKVSTFSFEYNVYGWWQSLLNHFDFMPFNMAYKFLKRRERFQNLKSRWAYLALHLAMAPVLLMTSFLLALLEATFNSGGVINVHATRDR